MRWGGGSAAQGQGDAGGVGLGYSEQDFKIDVKPLPDGVERRIRKMINKK
jgi:hypothetical protein